MVKPFFWPVWLNQPECSLTPTVKLCVNESEPDGTTNPTEARLSIAPCPPPTAKVALAGLGDGGELAIWTVMPSFAQGCRADQSAGFIRAGFSMSSYLRTACAALSCTSSGAIHDAKCGGGHRHF